MDGYESYFSREKVGKRVVASLRVKVNNLIDKERCRSGVL